MNGPVIALAADHAGFELKDGMKAVLDEHSYSLIDLGPETADPVDYPDMAGKLAAVLKDGRAKEGLLVCGTDRHRDRGQPLSLDTGRLCHDVASASLARAHNGANVLAFGARLIGPEVAARVSVDLSEDAFCRSRHARLVAKMPSAPAL